MLPEVTSLGRRHLADGSGVDVDGKGTWKDRSSMCSVGASQKKRKAVISKESAETLDFVSCQDMEVDRNKSLEELGVRPKCGG